MARAAPAVADAWRPRGAYVSARPIASLVPRVTQKAFEKHGFAAASLIMDWEQIVGRATAEATRPLKLKWPRGAAAEPSPDVERGRPAATLFLEVDPALALDVQYRLAELVERINGYFGYRAVSDIRLAQSTANPATRAAPAGHRSSPPAHQPAPPQNADTDPLTAALARLGAHIAGAATRRG